MEPIHPCRRVGTRYLSKGRGLPRRLDTTVAQWWVARTNTLCCAACRTCSSRVSCSLERSTLTISGTCGQAAVRPATGHARVGADPWGQGGQLPPVISGLLAASPDEGEQEPEPSGPRELTHSPRVHVGRDRNPRGACWQGEPGQTDRHTHTQPKRAEWEGKATGVSAEAHRMTLPRPLQAGHGCPLLTGKRPVPPPRPQGFPATVATRQQVGSRAHGGPSRRGATPHCPGWTAEKRTAVRRKLMTEHWPWPHGQGPLHGELAAMGSAPGQGWLRTRWGPQAQEQREWPAEL